MFCILSFLFLGLMGIFSTKYRELAKEAFECAFKRVTFKPCNTNFREKTQAKITAKVLNYSPRLAKILNKNFELLATLVLLLSLGSLLYSLRGLYNFYMYGSCNGLNSTGFCALDPTGSNNKISGAPVSCAANEIEERKVSLDNVDLSTFPKINNNSKDTVVFIGCYSCEFTRKAYPVIKDLVQKNTVNYVFGHYPVKDVSNYLMEVSFCAYQIDSNKYWELNDKLFLSDINYLKNEDYINTLLQEVGYNLESIYTCRLDPKTNQYITVQRLELEKTNIYGTPLVFINNKGFVGPKPYRVYERALKGLNFWN